MEEGDPSRLRAPDYQGEDEDLDNIMPHALGKQVGNALERGVEGLAWPNAGLKGSSQESTIRDFASAIG